MKHAGLETYLQDELFQKWKTNRTNTVELKWQENLDAFNCEATTELWKDEEGEKWRSKAFVPLTKIKIISAYSLVVDMLLQGGQLPFSLQYSPWDKLNYEDLDPQQQEEIDDVIEDMRGNIHQQLADCKADRQLLKCVLSGAMFGETWTKRFVHEVIRNGYQQNAYGQYQAFTQTINSPGFEYKSIWNMFWDMSNDDLQKNVGVVERQFLSPYDLKKKEGKKLYLPEAIKEVIAEAKAPGSPSQTEDGTLPPILRNIAHRYNTITGLEFWCRVPTAYVEDFEAQIKKKEKGALPVDADKLDGNETEIMALLADGKIVRYARVEENDRPYDRALWEINLDGANGIGVADNLKPSQLSVNGMWRSYEDNLKLAANVMLAIKRDLLGKWDGKFKPGMTIDIAQEVDDVRQALQQIIIEPVGDYVLSGLSVAERYADEASQLPKIMQGEVAEKRSSDTAYKMSQLIAAAGKYIGGVIKNYDEGLIEPNTRWMYQYNMDDPDYKGKKGNLIAKATGFTSYQDKIEKLQKLQQMLSMALSDEELRSEHKLRELLEEVYKILDIEPTQFLKTKEEKQKAGQEAQAAEEAQRQAMLALEEAMTHIEDEVNQMKHERDLEKEELKHENKLEEEELKHDLKIEEG